MNLHLPHNKRRDPKLIVGLFLLAFANLTQYLLPRFFGLGAVDGVDFVYGALMGAAIALMLWAVAGSRCRDAAVKR